MAIRFDCECGKKLSAPDHYAGREGKCSHCGKKFVIPGEPRPPIEERATQALPEGTVGLLTYQVNPKAVARAAVPPRKPRDYTYLVLLIALLPLFWTMLRPEDAGKRLEKTLKSASPQAQARVDEIKHLMNIEGPLPEYVLPYLDEEEFDTLPGGNVFDGLPGGKIEGAMLSRRSFVHWGFAAVAAVAFWLLIQTFFPRKTAEPRHLFYVGFFTGSAGVVMLFIVQALADVTRGWIPIPGGGMAMRGFFGFFGAVVTLIIWAFKLIAGSYDAALDPNANFFVSAFGFMIGVGLLEEWIKAIPLLWYTNSVGNLSWRACILWGLASGIGFGVSEGISYSADFYNGILAADIYVVRFVSCVALHAIWSASVAVFIYQQRELVESAVSPWEWINAAFTVVIISTFLHGLYDTMMKKELVLGGILVAVVSIGVLALQIEWLRKHGNKRRVAGAYAT
jgi:RsiW-degrading membrane proteinase PrsW (M82 family)